MEEVNKGGRPTKYKEEYCEELIKHMGKGLSFESFAGRIDVNRDSLYEWCKVHKEFSDAKRAGTEKSLLIWEEMGIDLVTGKAKGSTGAYIFNKKNRFGWTDRLETVNEHKGEGLTINYTVKKKDGLSDL